MLVTQIIGCDTPWHAVDVRTSDQQIGPHLIHAINSLAKIAHCYMTLSREQSAVRTGQLTRSEAVNVSQRTWTDRVLIGRRERLQGNSPGCRRIGKLALSRQFALVGTASSQPAGRDRRSDKIWLPTLDPALANLVGAIKTPDLEALRA